ncbi:MAG: hypothetical protein ACOCP8_00400 [archaeon]
MKRLIKHSSISSSQIIDTLQFMKNELEMDFIVIGGAAYNLHVNIPTKDIDVVVTWSSRILNFEYEEKLEQLFDYYTFDQNGEVNNFIYKDVPVTLLWPNVYYDIGEFKLNKMETENINGFEVLSLTQLMINDWERKRHKRVINIIKQSNLSIDFIKNFNDSFLRQRYLLNWEEANNVELDIEKAKKLINGN